MKLKVNKLKYFLVLNVLFLPFIASCAQSVSKEDFNSDRDANLKKVTNKQHKPVENPPIEKSTSNNPSFLVISEEDHKNDKNEVNNLPKLNDKKSNIKILTDKELRLSEVKTQAKVVKPAADTIDPIIAPEQRTFNMHKLQISDSELRHLKYVLRNIKNNEKVLENTKASDYLKTLKNIVSSSMKTDDNGNYIMLNEISGGLNPESINFLKEINKFDLRIYLKDLEDSSSVVVEDEMGIINLKVRLYFQNKNQENKDFTLTISNFLKPDKIWGKTFTYQQKSYIGNLETLYLDKRDGLLKNVNFSSDVKEWDSSKITPVYRGAANNYYFSEEDAKKSFLQSYKSKVKYSFDVDNGTNLNTEILSTFANTVDEAQRSKFQLEYKDQKIVYYEILLNGIKYRINPLNKKDVEKFKELLISNLSLTSKSDADFKLLLKTNDSIKKDVKDLYRYLKNKTTMTDEARKYFDDLSLNFSKKYDFQVNLSTPRKNKLQTRDDKQPNAFNYKSISDFFEIKATGHKNWVKFNDFVTDLNKLDNVSDFKKNFSVVPWAGNQNNFNAPWQTKEEYLKEYEELLKKQGEREVAANWYNIYKDMHKRVRNNSWRSKANILGQNISIQYKDNLDLNIVTYYGSIPLNSIFNYFNFGENGENGKVYSRGSFHGKNINMTSDEIYVNDAIKKDLPNWEINRWLEFVRRNRTTYGPLLTDIDIARAFEWHDYGYPPEECLALPSDAQFIKRVKKGLGPWNMGRFTADQRRVWLEGEAQIKLGQNLLNLKNNREIEKNVYTLFGLNDTGTRVNESSQEFQNYLKNFAYKNLTQQELNILSKIKSFNDPFVQNYLVFAKAKAKLHIEFLKSAKNTFKLGHSDKTNYNNFKLLFQNLFKKETTNNFYFNENAVYDVSSIHKAIQRDEIDLVLTYNGASVFKVDKSLLNNLAINQSNSFKAKIITSLKDTFSKEIAKKKIINISNNVFTEEINNRKFEYINFSNKQLNLSNRVEFTYQNSSWKNNHNLNFQVPQSATISNTQNLNDPLKRITYLLNNSENRINEWNDLLVLFDKSLNNIFVKAGGFWNHKNKNSIFDISVSDPHSIEEWNFYSNLYDKNAIKNKIFDNLEEPKKITYFLNEQNDKAIGIYISSDIYENRNEIISRENAYNSIDFVEQLKDIVAYRKTESSPALFIKNEVFDLVEVILKDGIVLFFDSIEKMREYIDK